jgi:hypothetical protein
MLIDFFAVLIWPKLAIYGVQAVIAGFIVGSLLGIVLRNSSAAMARVFIPGLLQPWIFGMLFGFLFYSNYAYTQWRLLLLLPLVYLVFRDWRKARVSVASTG